MATNQNLVQEVASATCMNNDMDIITLREWSNFTDDELHTIVVLLEDEDTVLFLDQLQDGDQRRGPCHVIEDLHKWVQTSQQRGITPLNIWLHTPLRQGQLRNISVAYVKSQIYAQALRQGMERTQEARRMFYALMDEVVPNDALSSVSAFTDHVQFSGMSRFVEIYDGSDTNLRKGLLCSMLDAIGLNGKLLMRTNRPRLAPGPQNQNLGPQNQNLGPQNQNLGPQNQNLGPQNQNLGPQNQNPAPQNQNPAPQNQNPWLPHLRLLRRQRRDGDPSTRVLSPVERQIYDLVRSRGLNLYEAVFKKVLDDNVLPPSALASVEAFTAHMQRVETQARLRDYIMNMGRTNQKKGVVFMLFTAAGVDASFLRSLRQGGPSTRVLSPVERQIYDLVRSRGMNLYEAVFKQVLDDNVLPPSALASVEAFTAHMQRVETQVQLRNYFRNQDNQKKGVVSMLFTAVGVDASFLRHYSIS